jgi:hypothetical protein
MPHVGCSGSDLRGQVPPVSRTARQVAELFGFVAYSGGLVAFVEASLGWPRWVAALVMFAGLILMGWGRWGTSRPRE